MPGEVTTLAGDGTDATVDGTGASASFTSPYGIVYSSGDLFVSTNGAIRRVSVSTGVVTTLTSGAVPSSCNPGTPWDPGQPTFPASVIAMDGDALYWGDYCTLGVRRTSVSTGATTAINDTIANLVGLTVGPDHMIYAALSNLEVQKIDPSNGVATAFASQSGSGAQAITSDGTWLWLAVFGSAGSRIDRISLADGSVSKFTDITDFPDSLVSIGGYLYVGGDSRVWRYSQGDGSLGDVAGTGAWGYQDGTSTDAWFDSIFGMASDGTTLWVADYGNFRLRQVSPGTSLPAAQQPSAKKTINLESAAVSTLATGFSSPKGLVTVGGYAYVRSRNKIERVNLSTGELSSFVGTGSVPAGCSVDSTVAAEVSFRVTGGPLASPMATDGYYLYTIDSCDDVNYYLRRTSLATGATSKFSESWASGYPYDLSGCCSGDDRVTVGPDGMLYVSHLSATIYRIDRVSGALSTFATEPDGAWIQGLTSDASGLYVVAECGPCAGPLNRVDHVSLGGAGELPAFATLSGSTNMPWRGGELTSAGSYLYGTGDNAVVRIAKSDGYWRNIAGGTFGYADGVGNAARFQFGNGYHDGIASDGERLYVVESGRLRVLSNYWQVSLASMYGHRQSQVSVGDPVDTASGNFADSALDLKAPSGVFGLDWKRSYNSRSTRTGILGTGWSTTFSDSIVADASGNATLTTADGRALVFASDGANGLTRPPDIFANLTRNGDDTWTLAWFNGETWTFDTAGRLARMASADGPTATAVRNTSGVLQSIASSTGAALALTYNAVGSLTAATASDGRAVSYAYNSSGILASVTRPGGRTTTLSVDATGRVAIITDATGVVVVANTYDAESRVVSQTSGSGVAPTLYAYDDSSGITTVSESATGQQLVYAHDRQGRVVAATDPLGKVATRSYDATTGDLTGVTNRLGANVSQSFDADGNVTSATDASGITTSATFDPQNRPVTVTNPASGSTTFTYAGATRVPVTVTEAGHVTTNVITNGRVTKSTDPDGVITNYSYNSMRRLASKTVAPSTPLAATTTFAYDTAGRMRTVTDPLGHVSTTTYNAAGDLTNETNPLGQTTSYAYDSAGRLLTTTDPTGAVTTNTYDTSGRLVSTSTPLGHTTTYAYDALGQQTAATFPDGSMTTQDYSVLGRTSASHDQLGRTTTNTYGDDGNPTSVTDPTTAVTQQVYDAAGRQTGTIDPLGRPVSTTIFDAAGRLASETRLGGFTSTYSYDSQGRPESTTGPRGGAISTTYTAAGRVASTTTPDGVTTTNAYDAAGRLVSQTSPRGVTTKTYDLAGRETVTRTPGGITATRVFDAADRVTRLTVSPGITTNYTYTARGQVATQVQVGNGTITNTYDTDGNLTAVTDGLGHVTTYGYDSRNRMVNRTDANGKTVQRTYDAVGNLTSRIDPLNRVTSFAYDDAGRPTSVVDASGRTATSTYDLSGQLTRLDYADGSHVDFTYNAAGRRSSMTDSTGTTNYTYEPGGKLAGITGPGGRATRFAYDSAGRRTRLTAPDGSSFTYAYDSAGRVASVTPGETAADTFTQSEGSAVDVNKWAFTKTLNGTSTISGNQAVLGFANQSTSSAALASTAVATLDGDLTVDYTIPSGTAVGKLEVQVRGNSTTSRYYAQVTSTGTMITLYKRSGAVITALGTVPTAADGAKHSLRFRVEGQTISLKSWLASQAEPTAWGLQVTDSVIVLAGKPRLTWTRTSGTGTVAVDNVLYKDLAAPPVASASYLYDADNHLTKETLPSGARTLTWTDGQLTKLVSTVPGYAKTTTLTYDAVGRLATEKTGTVTTTYTYDNAGQLTRVSPSGGTATILTYDQLGRRATSTTGTITTSNTYDDAGQLLSSNDGTNTTNYQYDQAGRRVGATGSAAATTYGYNSVGRLATITGAGTTQTLTYNGTNNLVGVAASGATTGTTTLDWDGTSLAQLVDIATTTTTNLVRGPAGWSVMRQGPTTRGIALDAHGDVISGTQTADIAQATGFDSFGIPTASAGSAPLLGYRGELAVGGLNHLRARNYDPTSGQFLTPDPLEGTNGTPTIATAYHYADNDPINQIDPGGASPGASAFAGGDDCNFGSLGIDAAGNSTESSKSVVSCTLQSDPNAYDGDGLAVVSYGNLATAKNIAVLVPGLGTTIWSTFGGLKENAARVQRLASNGGSTATVAWLGYDAPEEDWSVLTNTRALNGGKNLAKFVKHFPATKHVTISAHSYGTVVAAKAITENNLRVDDLILLGSPGVEEDSWSAFNGAQVWVGKAANDRVADWNSDASTIAGCVFRGIAGCFAAPDPFGPNPNDSDFGAYRFRTDPADGHSEYYKENTNSLENIAHIVAGRYGLVGRLDR